MQRYTSNESAIIMKDIFSHWSNEMDDGLLDTLCNTTIIKKLVTDNAKHYLELQVNLRKS